MSSGRGTPDRPWVIYTNGDLYGDYRTESEQLQALPVAAASAGQVTVSHWDQDGPCGPGWTQPREVTPVTVRPVAYLVSVWPDGHECGEMAAWSIKVAYRGHGKWAVERGWSEGIGQKPVMDADGHWHIDRPGDPVLRFSREDALELARRHAPAVSAGGMTAADALRMHDENGCPDE